MALPPPAAGRPSISAAHAALLLVPPLFWAGNAVAGRLAMGEAMSPTALSFWRTAVGLLLLLPFTLTATLAYWATVRRHMAVLLIMGALSSGSFNLLLYLALETTPALNATLVGATMPLGIMLLARVVLKDPLTRGRMAGLALSVAGVGLVVARGEPAALLALEVHAGDAIMLAAVAVWGTFSVLLRLYPVPVPPGVFLTVQTAGGVVFTLPLYLGALALGGGALPLNAEAAGLVAYVAIFPGLIAVLAWNIGVGAVGPNIAGFFTNLIPVFTAILAALLLGEAVFWYHGAGMALILAGVAMAMRAPRRPAPAATS